MIRAVDAVACRDLRQRLPEHRARATLGVLDAVLCPEAFSVEPGARFEPEPGCITRERGGP